MALTIAGITGAISSAFGGLVSGATTIVKMIAGITAGAAFFSAVLTLSSYIESVVFSSVVGEIFGIISCCLPFRAPVVFGSILVVINAILAFIVAKKAYALTMELIGVSH